TRDDETIAHTGILGRDTDIRTPVLWVTQTGHTARTASARCSAHRTARGDLRPSHAGLQVEGPQQVLLVRVRAVDEPPAHVHHLLRVLGGRVPLLEVHVHRHEVGQGRGETGEVPVGAAPGE